MENVYLFIPKHFEYFKILKAIILNMDGVIFLKKSMVKEKRLMIIYKEKQYLPILNVGSL